MLGSSGGPDVAQDHRSDGLRVAPGGRPTMTELERGAARTGTVTAFDVISGLGSIRADDGEIHEFHCIEIADGSRDIAVDTPVSFGVLAKFGRYEACDIRR